MKKNQVWTVHKFGGTSVGNAERYKNVAKIVTDLGDQAPRAIVVSAMKGVTDALIDLVECARKHDDSYLTRLNTIKNRHIEAVHQMLTDQTLNQNFLKRLDQDFNDIQEILRGIWLTKTASERNVEWVSGHGEVWSAQLLNALLQNQGYASDWLDAREVLVVEPLEQSVVVNWEVSTSRMKEWLAQHSSRLVIVTGFVASTIEGVATTLKRNGSDFSGSIFGALLEADEITIWTDVDGVLSADPRLVPEAVILDEVSYSEMAELAYFGAKVVHPATVEPAIGKNIPIWIRNTFNPKFRGTKIHSSAKSDRLAKGFSVIENIALINVEGTGMVGVPGIAERLFGGLRSAGVSVVMISQASSEHSICFGIYESQAELARKSVEKQFYAELQQGLIQRIEVTTDCAILAVVGDNMVQHPGISGRFFDALGKAGINIRAIAQGSSERNISAVIPRKDSTRALRSVHSAFFLSTHTLSVGIIGNGLIGKTLIRQLQDQAQFMKQERGIEVRIRGIMNSRKMLLQEPQANAPVGIPESLENNIDQCGEPSDIERFERHVRSDHLPHSVIIDATASSDIPLRYPHWLNMGMHIITPNKKANTADYASYRNLKETVKKSQRHFLYSTNVGAGLPIIQTLRDLHRTGDRIIRVEGVFSGTLSFIFNSFNEKSPFSEIVREARARGYTEPDPRDDLSGMDVARKLVILAREIQLPLELSDVQVESLVPQELQEGKVEDYLKALPSHDSKMKKLLDTARSQNQVIRYVGMLEPSGSCGEVVAKVGLQFYPDAHPFAHISGSDNIVVFKTQRYNTQPLVIQGPGAGPEVTAAGVFADLLKLSAYLGAPS